MEQRTSIARWILIAGVAALPLVVWDSFLFASTAAKTFFMYVVVDCALALALPEMVRATKQIVQTWLGRAVLTWFAVAVVASLLGANIYHSVWPGYERMMGLWTMGHLVLLFGLLSTLIRKQDWKILWSGIVAAGAAVSLLGILELLRASEYIRIESTLNNSAFLAAYVLVVVWVCISFIIDAERISWMLVANVGSLIVILTALVLTGTRSALVGLGAGGVSCAIMFAFLMPQDKRVFGLQQKTWRSVIIAGIVLVVLALVVLFGMHDKLAQSSNGLLRRLGEFSLSDRTVSGRALVWQVAWEGWKEHPIFGVGIENFNLIFNKHYNPALYPQEPWFDRAHNFIFDTLATTGFVGLFAYIMMFVVAITSAVGAVRRKAMTFASATGAVAILVSTFVQNLFFFDTITVTVLMYAVFAYIVFHIAPLQLSLETTKNQRPGAAMVIGSFLLAGILLWMGTARPLYENYLGRLAYDAFAKGDDAAGYQYTEQALAVGTYGDIDVRRGSTEYLFDFIKRGGERPSDAMKKLVYYEIDKMEQNITADPQDVKWRMYQGELYNIAAVYFGSPDKDAAQKAEKRFLEASELSSGRHQIYIEIAQARRIEGNIAGMWEALDHAQSLTPEYTLPHMNALVQAIELGDRDREHQERAWLEEHSWQKNEGEDPGRDFQNIRDSYFRAGRLSEAAEFQRRYVMLLIDVGADTRDSVLMAKQYAALADLERRAGHNDQAREAALSALKYNPSLKDQVGAFLRILR